MALISLVKTLTFAVLFQHVAALDVHLGLDLDLSGGGHGEHKPPAITTITIPYLGGHKTTTVITHCGITTVVVETPLITATCSWTTSTKPPTTTSSTSKSTSHPTTTIHTTTSVPPTTSTSESTTSTRTITTTSKPTTTSRPPITSTSESTTSTQPTTTSKPTTTSLPATTSTSESTTSTQPTTTSNPTTTSLPATTSTSECTTSTQPTTTTTTTHVPAPTPGGPCPLIKPGCPASGLNIDYYSNPFAGYSRQGSLPWSYYITQRLRPLASALTNIVFFPQDAGPPATFPLVYPSPAVPNAAYAIGWTKQTNGGIVVDANNFTLVYTGFYHAPETGRYSLCTTSDNENDVFFGHGSAFSCVDGATDPGARPLVVATWEGDGNRPRCAEVNMVRGEWYPLRSVMGNWAGPSAVELTIKTPSETVEQRKHDFSGKAYPHHCGLFI
ncbi:GLEYA adhesin domain protein [Cordyceps fumosorosea ARSEF 2679]|uniref:GLEYA adhesin domain protein n=1 Tax=Cordyceps fumosorosea (strain ARSEF 2679) TaxID=1081104 RepID=A0A167R4B0_CORFA|nr:GLEYA adhesin domain protein [Cordyceps fumosorosea ARSEF 2679]OAA58259.1 GLEYA adhesin domain protein [Cordyceps fumosorosea ARSEF 2679]